MGIFPVRDLALAFGYNVAVEDGAGGEPENGRSHESTDTVIVRFPKDFTGYLWAFPRPGVMNFGVASKLGERTSEELRRLLSGFVQDYYGGRMPDPDRVTFFGAKIPTLDLASWKDLRAVGDGWALVGDAADLPTCWAMRCWQSRVAHSTASMIVLASGTKSCGARASAKSLSMRHTGFLSFITDISSGTYSQTRSSAWRVTTGAFGLSS
jgi:hypothetical protein